MIRSLLNDLLPIPSLPPLVPQQLPQPALQLALQLVPQPALQPVLQLALQPVLQLALRPVLQPLLRPVLQPLPGHRLVQGAILLLCCKLYRRLSHNSNPPRLFITLDKHLHYRYYCKIRHWPNYLAPFKEGSHGEYDTIKGFSGFVR